MICKYKKLILSLFLSAAIPFGAALPVSAGIEALSGQINSGEVSKAFVPPENGPVVGRVTARYMLNVRKSPWGEIIDGFYPGVKVDIFGFEGEWYQIRYGGGVAYVHTSLITIESGNPRSLAADVEFPVKGTTTARYSLNVRRSPWGEIIDGLPLGTEVDITGRDGDWYIISHGGGSAYVHISLVSVIGAGSKPATPGAPEKPSTPQVAQPADTAKPATPAPQPAQQAKPENGGSSNKPGASNGINGPGIPPELIQGIEAAKRTQWYTTPNKCLQFAGTVAHEAGAPDAGKTYTQPQAIWPADKRLRGYYINQLPKAVEAGTLLPGMLIHVKVHYDYDPAYNPVNDAHHWFVYVGKDAQGVPRFTDNVKSTNLQTAEQVYNYMNGGSAKKYGDSKYGYNRRVHAIFDPFASVR